MADINEFLQEIGGGMGPGNPHLLGRQAAQDRPPTIRSPADIKPLHDHIIIRALPMKLTKGGIALPDSAERQMAAYVERIGPGRLSEYGARSEMSVQPGDVVYLTLNPLYPPMQIESDDRDTTYYMIRDRDLMAAADGEALDQFRAQLKAESTDSESPPVEQCVTT